MNSLNNQWNGVTYSVTNATELQQALDNALPGDTIVLADGVYSGNFVIDHDGTSENPITLMGSPNAILNGGSTDSGYGLYLNDANYWKLEGFTVTNALKGIMLDSSNHNLIDGVTVHTIGHEGVHFRQNSSHNTIQYSSIHETGKKPPQEGKPDLGEGIYIGSAKSNWERYMGDPNTPDRSNYNKVLYNTIGENVTAEAIDIKEGTEGGEIIGNTLDAAGKTGANSYIDVKGNEYLIQENILVNNPNPENYGIDVFKILTGWGKDNTFISNINQSNLSLAKLKLNTGVTGTTQIGTRDDDILRGNQGNDQIFGLGGHDFLTGGSGNDTLNGGGGADTLNGVDSSTNYGFGERDVLIGGGGGDLFILGNSTTVFYDDNAATVAQSKKGQAVIKKFEVGVDLIQLSSSGSYQLKETKKGSTLIYETSDSVKELIGTVVGVTDLDLENSNHFSFV